jgi:hypothetical protein
MNVKGRGGTVTTGGRVAATLGEWTLRYTPQAMELTAALVAPLDTFWLEHGSGFVLTVPYGSTFLRWRDVSIMQQDSNEWSIIGKERDG